MSNEPIIHTSAGVEGKSIMNTWADGSKLPEETAKKLADAGMIAVEGKFHAQPDYDAKKFAAVAKEISASDQPNAKEVKKMTMEFAANNTGVGKGRIYSSVGMEGTSMQDNEVDQTMGRMPR